MIVAPPFEVQQRAWEASYVLRSDYADRLPIENRVLAEEVYRTGPDRLGWGDVQAMLQLATAAIGVRV